ncbi:hypothetical protein HHL25_00605 [Rhizobium sp. S-51]|uniref:Outer membrane lipoprotein n=1 Tax=Rhizobium terricola TaxID=2728849 RepID=A0A7Y0FUJ8_9HYPH|nr:hypothetical protein [Rhizobium terricola]NML72614.1 hypothetical protein [Rhizobium terricola]
MKIRSIFTLVACAAALSACTSSGPRPLPPISQGPTVDGAWVDANGLVSTFGGGRLETRTSDGSNKVMATGTYTQQANNLVSITLFSNIKQTTTQANCAMVTPNQLNCTSESGAQFSLARRG